MYYPIRMPGFMQQLFPELTWRLPVAPGQQPVVYLTFDDGPIPVVTPQIQEWLRQAGASATFFMVGNNAVRHPELVQQHLALGFGIANHTYNHASGWRVSKQVYHDEITRTDTVVQAAHRQFGLPHAGAKPWLRPPYGHLPVMYKYIVATHRVAMWDVVAGDWDPQYTPQDCLRNVIDNWQPGSVIVLHDSVKCAERCLYVVPRLLEHFSKIGVMVKALPA
jgi:peptidoglycan/xylan/chitin deacetylase (PgdA/CDA1 family)